MTASDTDSRTLNFADEATGKHAEKVDIEKASGASSDGAASEQPVETPADVDVVEAEQPSHPEYPSAVKLLVIILGLYLVIFLVALDQTIIGTAIPKITDQFHSIGDIGWYGSAYFLTSTALQPSYGRIYRIFSVGCVPGPI